MTIVEAKNILNEYGFPIVGEAIDWISFCCFTTVVDPYLGISERLAAEYSYTTKQLRIWNIGIEA